jgi:hypothetical protein
MALLEVVVMITPRCESDEVRSLGHTRSIRYDCLMIWARLEYLSLILYEFENGLVGEQMYTCNSS